MTATSVSGHQGPAARAHVPASVPSCICLGAEGLLIGIDGGKQEPVRVIVPSWVEEPVAQIEAAPDDGVRFVVLVDDDAFAVSEPGGLHSPACGDVEVDSQPDRTLHEVVHPSDGVEDRLEDGALGLGDRVASVGGLQDVAAASTPS